MEGVEIKLVDGQGEAVPTGSEGEIWFRGFNVMREYLDNPEETAKTITPDGWLKTGDLGCFNERGFLRIIGRKKEILVTSGGKNIPPQNIELRFRNDSLISQVVVYGDGKKYLTALVDINEQTARAFLAEAGELESGSIRGHPLIRRLVGERIAEVNRGLAPFETIKDFVIAAEPLTVESGMLTPSLKIRRARVYESHRAALESLYRPRSG